MLNMVSTKTLDFAIETFVNLFRGKGAVLNRYLMETLDKKQTPKIASGCNESDAKNAFHDKITAHSN